jgi:hypothetical protein
MKARYGFGAYTPPEVVQHIETMPDRQSGGWQRVGAEGLPCNFPTWSALLDYIPLSSATTSIPGK